MKAFTASQMRSADADTVARGICSSFELMQHAGTAAADIIVRDLLPLFRTRHPMFHILTGAGNNGGDGFVIAGILARQFGTDRVIIHSAVSVDRLRGDARTAYENLPDPLRQSIVFTLNPADFSDENTVIIDCLLGTGISGELREPFRAWIGFINGARRPVISIDVPSGLNADDGTVSGGAVLAASTLTFAAPKIGLLTGQGPRFCGRLRVLDIGIPPDLIDRCTDMPDVTDARTVRRLYAREDTDTYKQKRGRVLIVGGSADYPSAPFLSAEAALRAGAGLVTVAVPASVQLVSSVPRSLIVRRIPDENGVFSAASVSAVRSLAAGAGAVAIGPGMTHGVPCKTFFAELLNTPDLPRMVIDADALNCLAEMPELAKKLPPDSVLTPHAGERTRLERGLGGDVSEKTSSCVVMKGPFSQVWFAPDDRLAFNLSGSPALATAGSGDVLTGIVSAFLAKKNYSAFDAARIAVFLHGLTGDLASERIGCKSPDPAYGCGVIADDLIAAIPAALREIMPY